MEKPTNGGTVKRRRWAALGLALTLIAYVGDGRPAAQVFDSGSDGSDGALTLPSGQGTIVFDPRDTVRWGKVLDPDGDGVYHFTTITIGSGTTLRLSGDKVNKPVHFLASGAIVISGELNLDAERWTSSTELHLRRQVPIPGSGGYAGGAGGRIGGEPATAGEGPGGGSGGVTSGSTQYGQPCGPGNVCGKGGTFTGNRYLVPMIGGSGGEGARWNDGTFNSGGAGGGAILLASSVSISVTGRISARGGDADRGGAGAGGAIRLVAPTLTGSGNLNVQSPRTAGANVGTNGWVRLEGFQISNSFGFDAGPAFVTRGAPVDAATLRPSGSVRVAAIAGIPLPIYPSGTFALPDAAINSADPVSIDIEATGIPPGTVVTLRVSPDTPENSATVSLPEVQATLQGTMQQSTATVQFSFPYGFSRGYVRASWTQ